MVKNKNIDTFASDLLPDIASQPTFLLDQSYFFTPESLNCAYDLLDRHVENGNGNKIALQSFTEHWTYQELYEQSNQIAQVLVDDFGLVPGNRVLIRSTNNIMFVACWFGILKAGGIVVSTMPLLREKELQIIVDKAEIKYAFCEYALLDELIKIKNKCLKTICIFYNQPDKDSSLEKLMSSKKTTFPNHPSTAETVALIAFTSGTTGNPKMTAHYHRDIILCCKGYPKQILEPTANDIFIGSAPLAFTFGLGGLVMFPLYYGASSILVDKPTPDNIMRAIAEFKATICFTAPTAWKVIANQINKYDISSLRKCVSAGENLSISTAKLWTEVSNGLHLLDGIGATEMLHIFISSNDKDYVYGSTGKPITGYEAKIIDENGNELPIEKEGWLAVRGITGCRYLGDDRQKKYVKNGWNITGDIFKKDNDGFYWYVSRGDDMIVSSGYNISPAEIENTLLSHPAILECAVVGTSDEERGQVICAYIVLKEPTKASEPLKEEIQVWFKNQAAPYKYPRKIVFIEQLPKNPSGKITRFKLRENEQ